MMVIVILMHDDVDNNSNAVHWKSAVHMITDHFSGPDGTVGPVCVCVSRQ